MAEEVETETFNVTIRKDVIEWIDENIKSGRFVSRSEAFECAVTVLQKIDAEHKAGEKRVRVIKRGTPMSPQDEAAARFGGPDVRTEPRFRF